jgi:hypothetical protein
MHAGAQGRRQRRVPRNDECDSTDPANPRQPAAECRALGLTIVAEDDSGQSDREPRRSGARIRKSPRVREQP